MSPKPSTTAAPLPEPQHSCPNCGYCPHCGRSNVRPFVPFNPVYPVYPTYPTWPWPQPYWATTTAPLTVTYSGATDVQVSGGTAISI